MHRLFRHVGFWLFYLLLQGYIGAELSNPSYSEESFAFRIWKVIHAELFVLPLKMLITYFFMYFLYPRYSNRSEAIGSLMLKTIFVLIAVAVAYRFVLSEWIRPIVYDSEPLQNPLELARILWTIFDLFAIAGIALSIKVFKDRNKQRAFEQALIQEKLESELNFLRAQLNPHFLFNTLNNIYGLARKKSDVAPEAILQLSKIMRYMIYECNSSKTRLKREIEIMKDYIELEKLRYGDRLNLTYKETIDRDNYEMVPLLMLPIIENAFKHGVSEARNDLHIDISIKAQAHQLSFVVKNTFDKKSLDSPAGIGLKNIRRQLELTYPEQYTLSTGIEDTTFKTYLLLPL